VSFVTGDGLRSRRPPLSDFVDVEAVVDARAARFNGCAAEAAAPHRSSVLDDP
jgi:hypothetical protein